MAAAAAVLAVAAPPALGADRTVTVSGTATVKAPNDTALLHFRVVTRDRRPATALDDNSVRMRRMIRAIEGQGVAPRDIQTEQVGLSRHRVGAKHHRHVVYVAANQVNVTVHRIRVTGDVIDAAVHHGATSFNGAEFSTSKIKQLRLQALGAAFDNAKAKATVLADHAGATLGQALTIDEGLAQEGYSYPQADQGGATGVPIEPGIARVTASVTVTFALE